MTRFLHAVLAISLIAAAPVWAAPSDFPRPASLEDDVQFWIRIYTEVGTNGGLIHDSRNLSVVYEKVEYPSSISRRERERRVEKRKKIIIQSLRNLGAGKQKLSADDRRIRALFPPETSRTSFQNAVRQVRFQLGQSDKFRAGVIRSGAWISFIRETLREMDVPLEIASLPHVESSFTPHAYSRVGAAGLWQFTRSTGRRFMRIDHVVDERLDPFKATAAAGRLMKQNRQVTGSWPLAITAYNHGASGMRRAASRLGTRDITSILRKYKSRTFGFASRNFYVEFLAASAIAQNHERYFGTLHLNAPIDYETITLPYFTTGNALANALGVSAASLKDNNPALLPSVWREAKYIPRDFKLRIPRSQLSRPVSALLGQLPRSQRHASQTRDLYHHVSRGDNLSGIARRYHTTVSELMALNGLRSRNRIRAGQKLRLPQDGRSSVQVASIDPGRVSTPPANGLYTVRRGDSLYGIAKRFGLSEQQLLAMNAVRNRHQIQVGQVLRVSASSAPTSTRATKIASAKPAPAAPKPRNAKPTPKSEPEPPPAVLKTVAMANLDPEIKTTTDGPAAGTIVQAPGSDLIADPSDYSVASNRSIEVQATETLGHFADWLEIQTHRLRQINHLKYGNSLPIGKRIKLDFSRVSAEEFERRRTDHHREMQEEFFRANEIAGTQTHVIRRGDSLWMLSKKKYDVPAWLLRQYNPDLDFSALTAGTRVTVPRLKRREGAS